MCLDIVYWSEREKTDEWKVKPLQEAKELTSYKEGYGWKIFNKGFGRDLFFKYFAHAGSWKVPVNRWLKAEGKKKSTRSLSKKYGYRPSFHVYLERPQKPPQEFRHADRQDEILRR